jgi:hypothetical protein
VGFLAVKAPTAKFQQIGQTIGGEIVDARRLQTSQYKTNRPEYWENGTITFAPYDSKGEANDPKAQLEVTVETGVADENGETERRLFIKNKRQMEALTAALKKARARQGLLIGGSLWMTWTGKEAGQGSEDANTWEIRYEAPPPGGGQEVDETVRLIGGGTWRKGLTGPPQDPAPSPGSGSEEGAGLRERTREVIDRLAGTHESSPLAARLGIVRPPAPDEPPF